MYLCTIDINLKHTMKILLNWQIFDKKYSSFKTNNSMSSITKRKSPQKVTNKKNIYNKKMEKLTPINVKCMNLFKTTKRCCFIYIAKIFISPLHVQVSIIMKY